jgi:uncharacterized protein
MKAYAPLAAVAFLALPALAGPAAAQSFNCNYAKLPTEVAICQDDTLSYDDQLLASEYSHLTNDAPGWAARQIKSEENAWLSERNACGYDTQCIMDQYHWRMQKLDDWSSQLGL